MQAVSTSQVASALARLILGGDSQLIPPVVEFGKTLLDGGDITEQHRQDMAKAVSQYRVAWHYVEAEQQIDERAHARLLRQIALHVYFRSEKERICSMKLN
jgi:hypothetical protein